LLGLLAPLALAASACTAGASEDPAAAVAAPGDRASANDAQVEPAMNRPATHAASDRPANRLASETSPYLLQHARNPVDWYPWGPEALARAKDLDRPIFLSVGYSACHWCHVMERESFENERIARLLNESFVCVKVDREERPDIDEIYMKAVQALSGSGGWPMSVFLTPDLEPFFGGTYFPPVRRYGRPGFDEIVQWIASKWKNDRAALVRQGQELARAIRAEGQASTAGELDPAVLDAAFAALAGNYDPIWGGFGGAPKFPHALDVRACLRHWRRTGSAEARMMATHTLARMARGGMYDQLAGGFHRYSTDEKWLIPHFEKMLYDSALLVPAYLEAYLATGDAEHARIARECCDWLLAEMCTPSGGFASAQDADSEGEEGKHYVWTPAELDAALGPELGGWAASAWGVTAEGNFEHGRSALWLEEPLDVVASQLGVAPAELGAALDGARARLLAARKLRVPPSTDDKVLPAWNGLVVSALAQSAQVLGEPRHLAAAQRAARYVLEGMRQGDGRLHASARGGRAHLDATLDDYAFMIQALLDLYETDFDARWLRDALALEQVLADRFWDARNGGYFTTGSDHEVLIARLKNPHDGALPAGNGVMALALLRLAELTGKRELAERAGAVIESQAELVARYPAAFSQLLQAVDWLAVGPREIVIAGRRGDPATEALLAAVRGAFLPQRVVALAEPGADEALIPLLAGRIAAPGEPARAYVCRNYACLAPVSTPDELRRALAE
jgi:uncharacterized protein YyaL (SSP411 family)